MNNKINVVIIEQSALFKSALTELLEMSGEIRVIGSAANLASFKKEQNHLKPDVITLDIETPTENGMETLEFILDEVKVPVLVISAFLGKKGRVICRAMHLLNVLFLEKPLLKHLQSINPNSAPVIDSIRELHRRRPPRTRHTTRENKPGCMPHPERIIAIGASTGGPKAIETLLKNLPPDISGIVISQHMNPFFTASFAEQLNRVCPITVQEACNGAEIKNGVAYIAPGDKHLQVVKTRNGYVCTLNDQPEVNGHRPSVDLLFESVARHAGADAIGILLTGMGADGASGLKQMQDAGAITIGQDQTSCVVYGMPKAAAENHAVRFMLPIHKIAEFITGLHFR